MDDAIRIKLTIDKISDTLYNISDGITKYTIRTTSDKGKDIYCLYKYFYVDNYDDSKSEKFVCAKKSFGECLEIIYNDKMKK